MGYRQIVHVDITGSPSFETTVDFGLPGPHGDADVQTVAQAIVQGYEALYGTQVRDGGLFQVDLSRQITPPAPPV